MSEKAKSTAGTKKPANAGAAVAPASQNPMREPRIDKVVVNIGVGEAGEKLVKAMKVLEMLTKRKPTKTISKGTNRDWQIRQGMPIGCKVTLRRADADDFLKRAFWITHNKVSLYNFDREGNFSMGVKDYTDFQGMKYDPEIGIFGMDICVTMRRRGAARVPRRRKAAKPFPKNHRLTVRESVNLLKNKFQLEVIR